MDYIHLWQAKGLQNDWPTIGCATVRHGSCREVPSPKTKKNVRQRSVKIEAQLTTHLAKIDLAQLDINKTEAAHRSVFVSGWRPFIGWSCGAAMALNFIVFPLASFVLAQTGHLVKLPTLDMSEMMPVLMGLLGSRRIKNRGKR